MEFFEFHHHDNRQTILGLTQFLILPDVGVRRQYLLDKTGRMEWAPLTLVSDVASRGLAFGGLEDAIGTACSGSSGNSGEVTEDHFRDSLHGLDLGAVPVGASPVIHPNGARTGEYPPNRAGSACVAVADD